MIMGWAGAVLAACMVAMGLALALELITAGAASDQITDAQRFSILPLSTSLLFGTLVVLAIAYRRRAALHKRLMLLAMISMVPPAIVRLAMPLLGISPVSAMLGTAVLVALCMAHDLRTRGRIHPVYWIGGLALILSFPARFWLMQTDLWLSVTQLVASAIS
jgi:hypothetical protein